MTIAHDSVNHRFTMTAPDGAPVGELEYIPHKPDEWLATSTKVYAGFEGHGYAGQLLDALVALAVQKQAKITPLCSYVSAAFRKYPEKYAAVIKK